MKFNRRNGAALREFMEKMDGDGCLTVDKWTSGSGQHTTNRALPPFVSRHERGERKADAVADGTCRTAHEFFERGENARRKAVLVLDRDALVEFLFGNSYGIEYR